MAVVSIGGAAPPPRSVVNVQFPADPKLVALAEAFDKLAKSEPALFQGLMVALHDVLDPEIKHIVRVPPDKILISQGRVQVADDILKSLDYSDAIARRAREKQQR